ncbi:MAG: hypothetical protein JNN20_17865 [Betaproteobacteria bacterium]|nr:hypothetical protein [Betaproteobacteria bacterium]
MARPLQQRIGPAPEELLVHLNLDNIASGIANRPRHAVLAADFLADVRAAIAELPPTILQKLGDRLVGIYFVRDLGGTAQSDLIDGGWFRRDLSWIVLDADVLSQRNANAWATWKENTPFKPNPAYALSATIETAANDNRKNAIRYILLHEIGHVLSIGEKVHPPWDRPVTTLDGFSFAQLSWQLNASKTYVSQYDHAGFADRSKVVYYFGAKLDGAKMPEIYQRLEKTNFPTLYAATNPGDDFAESFASYVHTVMQKRPWEINILANGNPIKTYRTCWDEVRCAEKRKLLEKILGIAKN